MPIRYSGIRSLNESEKFKLKKISEKSYQKIERYLTNPMVGLTIKKQDATGRRSRITINARISSPNIRYSSAAEDWDISKVTHKVFDKLEREIKHNIKV